MQYFEDLIVGSKASFGNYPVTREDVVEFARKFDPQPFHLSDEAAAETHFGRLSASGWHTCALFMRMMFDGWLKESASMGAPGIDRLKWMRPVRPGDVLSGRSVVVDVRPSRSRPDRGFVHLRHEIVDARGDLVMLLEHPFMVTRRAA